MISISRKAIFAAGLIGALSFSFTDAYADNAWKIIHRFSGSDGDYPRSTLALGKDGNFYGTTALGGTAGHGTVFKVTPKGDETVLYSFASGTDGEAPYGGVIFDKQGNLYGTTSLGGDSNNGTIFQLAPDRTETILHSFAGGSDGRSPAAGLTRDGGGNLYGTTNFGGASDGGTVFKLTPDGTESVIHSFAGTPSDGFYPVASLILDKKGDLIGTTAAGGANNLGTVFKIARDESFTLLHSFGGSSDGSTPEAGLVMDKKGNFYGTTIGGGTGNQGVVFELTGKGVETVLHSFSSTPDGTAPYGSLIIDKQDDLYGTTSAGGIGGIDGIVFKLAPGGREKSLHHFGGGSDGVASYAGLVMGAKGKLYGTTALGGGAGCGGQGCGTVFEVNN